jgi:hypothetical protein
MVLQYYIRLKFYTIFPPNILVSRSSVLDAGNAYNFFESVAEEPSGGQWSLVQANPFPLRFRGSRQPRDL